MIRAENSRELERLILGEFPLSSVATDLRELKSCGLSREAAYQILASFRDRAPDEAAEDRVLEVMDIVSGFCAPELLVWD